MQNWKIGLAVGTLGLAVAACGPRGSGAEDEAEVGATTAAGDAQSATAVDTAAVTTETAKPSPSATETAAPAAASAAATTDLTAYIGKFPFDEVGGVKWDDHPMVVAGIGKTVKNAAARRAIVSLNGPSAPIGTYQGKVGSWACEQHNCGDHQWAVLINPSSGATDVCYHNAGQTGANSRWFLASGSEETRPGDCSVV